MDGRDAGSYARWVRSEAPANDPIEVVPYDDRWPGLFEVEKRRIEAALGPRAVAVEHVGSTAVPGLAAKPVIDIMVGVRSLSDSPSLVERLEGVGYEYVPELEEVMPFRRYFRRLTDGRRTHQIHLVEIGQGFWDDHLLFRGYLRAHPEASHEYARLKLGLAERFRDDREAYTEAKTDFISGILRRARENPGD